MDPELKKLLEENLAIAKDNNQILRGIRHHQWLSGVLTVIIWVFALAIPVYLYQHYLQPIVSRFYPASGTATSSAWGFPTTAEIQKLLNSFKAQQ